MMRLVGDPRSGNCQKVAFVARHLDLPLEWEEIDVLSGVTRSAAFLQRNPAGQVPFVEFDDGRVLAQSNAILLYLAEGSTLVPDDAWQRAETYRLLFWEQYTHEPTIAVVRFQHHFLGRPLAEIDADKIAKGNAALDLMERELDGRSWFVEETMTVADLALVAYTRWAHEGGFDLSTRPAVRAWIDRVEREIPLD